MRGRHRYVCGCRIDDMEAKIQRLKERLKALEVQAVEVSEARADAMEEVRVAVEQAWMQSSGSHRCGLAAASLLVDRMTGHIDQ